MMCQSFAGEQRRWARLNAHGRGVDEVRQLLVCRDDLHRTIWVNDYGDDLDAAHDAYCVCLFGTDLLATLKRTHSSWFPEGYRVMEVDRT